MRARVIPEAAGRPPGQGVLALAGGATLILLALALGGAGFIVAEILGGPARPTPLAENSGEIRPTTPEELERLVTNLGSDSWRERSESTRRLIAIGQPALENLRRVLESPDPEVVWRAEEAIREIEWTASRAGDRIPGRPAGR